MQHQDHDSTGCSCKCVCHKTLGIGVMILGLTFLLANLDVISQRVVSIVWPSLLILVGIMKTLGSGMCKCCCSGKSDSGNAMSRGNDGRSLK